MLRESQLGIVSNKEYTEEHSDKVLAEMKTEPHRFLKYKFPASTIRDRFNFNETETILTPKEKMELRKRIVLCLPRLAFWKRDGKEEDWGNYKINFNFDQFNDQQTGRAQ